MGAQISDSLIVLLQLHLVVDHAVKALLQPLLGELLSMVGHLVGMSLDHRKGDSFTFLLPYFLLLFLFLSFNGCPLLFLLLVERFILLERLESLIGF